MRIQRIQVANLAKETSLVQKYRDVVLCVRDALCSFRLVLCQFIRRGGASSSWLKLPEWREQPEGLTR